MPAAGGAAAAAWRISGIGASQLKEEISGESQRHQRQSGERSARYQRHRKAKQRQAANI